MNDCFRVKCNEQDHCKLWNCEKYGPLNVNHHNIWTAFFCPKAEKLVYPELVDMVEYGKYLEEHRVLLEKEGIMVPEEGMVP